MLNALCRETIFSTLNSSCEVIYSCCALTFLYSYPFMSVFICSHVLFFSFALCYGFFMASTFLKESCDANTNKWFSYAHMCRAYRDQLFGVIYIFCTPKNFYALRTIKHLEISLELFSSRAIYVVSRCKHNLTLNSVNDQRMKQ